MDIDPDGPPPPREKLSKTPSWIMVGFVVGCIFAYTVQEELERRHAAEVARNAPPPAAVAPQPKPEPPAPAQYLGLNEIEAIFLGSLAGVVWENDLTEVAMWNPATQKFSELVEVMRSGDYFYFRAIPRLTRPLISANVEPGVLLRYTEPERVRSQRLESIPPFLRPQPPKLTPEAWSR